MRKVEVALAVGGVLLSFMTNVATAQLRRARTYENQGGQFQQEYGQTYQQPQGYTQGQQYQRGGQQQSGQRYYAQRPSGSMQASFTDQQLASWLLVDNRGEIELARLAQEHASSDDVKDFAKKVIDDHAKMVEELQPYTGMSRGMRQRGNDYQAGQERGQFPQASVRGNQQSGSYTSNRGNQQYEAYSSNRGNQQSGSLNLVRLKQQLGQQCLASAEQELEQKDGDEFDKCYIGLQIAKHMEMLDTLKVFSRYASPQLDQLIEQAEETTQDHLDHAKHLIKQLERGGGDRSSSSSRSSDRSSSEREARRDRSSDDNK